MKQLTMALFLLCGLFSLAQDDGMKEEGLKEVPEDFLDAFDTDRAERSVKTISNSVFALGWNQALGDGNGIGDDYRFWGSGIWELGIEFSTRISPNDKLRFNYGLAMQWQTLRINNNRQFETNNDITSLQTIPFDVDKSKFQQFTLIAPLHLEIGRGKVKEYENGITRMTYDDTFVVGIGGYVGVNTATSQLLKFERDGRDISNRLYNDFEMEDFVYGLSAYAGHGNIQIFAKYGLNTIFKNSPVDQQYASIGFRFTSRD